MHGRDDLMLPEFKAALVSLKPAISVKAIRMENKIEVHQPFDATLTHFAFPMATVAASICVAPPQELRIDLTGESNEKNRYLYARVTDTVEAGEDYSHTLHVSYVSPEAALLFDRLMKS